MDTDEKDGRERTVRDWEVDEDGKATLVTPEFQQGFDLPEPKPEPTPPSVFPLAVLDLVGWKFTVSKDQLLLETAPINGTPGIMYLSRGSMLALRAVLDIALDEFVPVPEEEHLMVGRLIEDGSLGVAR